MGSFEYMPLTEEEVRSRIEHGKSQVLIAEDAGKVVGSVTYSDGYWGEEIRWLVVRRATDQRLVEDLLVSEAEKLVRGETVFTSVDLGSPETVEWARRGYSVDGGLYQMVAGLEGSRAIPDVPEGIVLRSMRLGEEKNVVDVVNTVSGGNGWSRISLRRVRLNLLRSTKNGCSWPSLKAGYSQSSWRGLQ